MLKRINKITAVLFAVVVATGAFCLAAEKTVVKKPAAASAKNTQPLKTAAKTDATDPTAAATDARPSLGKYQSIVDANIFGYLETSKPTPATETVKEETPPETLPAPVAAPVIAEPDAGTILQERLEVTGIMSLGENERRVILKDADGSGGFYLGVGGEAMGARVVEIGKDNVVLNTESGKITLYLQNKKPSSSLIPYNDAKGAKEDEAPKPEDMPFPQRSRMGGK